MLRATLLGVLLLAACSLEPPPDLVVYRAAPQALPGGESRMRSLLITGDRRVLAVDRGPAGVVVRAGSSGGSFEDLRTALARSRHLPVDTAANEPDVRTWQISAVLGSEKVQLIRDPRRRVERDAELAVEALEAIWRETEPVEDVVAAVAPFLASTEAKARGWACVVLTKIWHDEAAPAERKAAVEAALRKHLETEEDRAIIHGIRDVIDQPGDQPEEE